MTDSLPQWGRGGRDPLTALTLHLWARHVWPDHRVVAHVLQRCGVGGSIFPSWPLLTTKQ